MSSRRVSRRRPLPSVHNEDPRASGESNLPAVRRPAQPITARPRDPAKSAPVNSSGQEPATAQERDPAAVRRPRQVKCGAGLHNASPQPSVVAHDVHGSTEKSDLAAVGRPDWRNLIAVRTAAQIPPRASGWADDENLPVVRVRVLLPEPIRVRDPPSCAGSGDLSSRRGNAQRANDNHQRIELHSTIVTLPAPNVQAQKSPTFFELFDQLATARAVGNSGQAKDK